MWKVPSWWRMDGAQTPPPCRGSRNQSPGSLPRMAEVTGAQLTRSREVNTGSPGARLKLDATR